LVGYGPAVSDAVDVHDELEELLLDDVVVDEVVLVVVLVSSFLQELVSGAIIVTPRAANPLFINDFRSIISVLVDELIY